MIWGCGKDVGYLKPQGCLQLLARTLWDAGAGRRTILPSPALPLGSSPCGRVWQPAPCNLLVCHFAHSIANVKLHLQSLGRTVGKGPPSHASAVEPCRALLANQSGGETVIQQVLGG